MQLEEKVSSAQPLNPPFPGKGGKSVGCFRAALLPKTPFFRGVIIIDRYSYIPIDNKPSGGWWKHPCFIRRIIKNIHQLNDH
jgi:hypothetical protein